MRLLKVILDDQYCRWKVLKKSNDNDCLALVMRYKTMETCAILKDSLRVKGKYNETFNSRIFAGKQQKCYEVEIVCEKAF